MPPPGAWVKLRKVPAQAAGGQGQLVYGGRSHWAPQPPAPAAAALLEERRAAGAVAQWAPAEPSELVARPADAPAGRVALPRWTVRQALLAAGAAAAAGGGAAGPLAFRLLARAVGHHPFEATEAVEWVPSAGPSGGGGDAPAAAAAAAAAGAWELGFVLHLEDATGSLPVLAAGPAAAALLGVPPPSSGSAGPLSDPTAGLEVARLLRERLAALEGFDPELTPGGVWMECEVLCAFGGGEGDAAAGIDAACFVLADAAPPPQQRQPPGEAL